MKQTRRFTAEDLKARMATNRALADANPDFRYDASAAPEQGPVGVLTTKIGKDSQKAPKRGKRRREMNATEREFSMMLEKKVRDGELVSFDYEGITLRFGDLKYTADFNAVESVGVDGAAKLVFFEVKGGHIFDAGLVRFKAAKHNYPLFRFELWQKKQGQWSQL